MRARLPHLPWALAMAGSVACAACRIEDFSRFTFSFNRRSITPQTLSNTLWAARPLRTKTRRSSA